MQESVTCSRDSTSMLTRFKEDVAASSGERYGNSRSMLLKYYEDRMTSNLGSSRAPVCGPGSRRGRAQHVCTRASLPPWQCEFLAIFGNEKLGSSHDARAPTRCAQPSAAARCLLLHCCRLPHLPLPLALLPPAPSAAAARSAKTKTLRSLRAILWKGNRVGARFSGQGVRLF